MSFIAKHMSSRDERLIYVVRPHWIYIAKGLLWFFVLLSFGVACDAGLWCGLNFLSPRSDFPFFLPFVVSLRDDFFIFLFAVIGFMTLVIFLLKYFGTEIGLTNHRVIYKTGLFFVAVEELDLLEIKEESVNHGILGGLFHYGEVKLDSRFVGDITLPAIKDPYKMLKIVHKMRRSLPPEPHDPAIE